MADDQQSLIADPFAPAEGPQPFETRPASPPPRPSSLISDPRESDRLQQAARRAPATPPDQAARVLRLQRRTGLPLEVIERNTDEVERQSSSSDFDVERYRRESPLLSQWLAEHPAHMALAQDDLRPLAGMEAVARRGRNLAGAVGAAAAGVKESFWGMTRLGGEVTEEVTGATQPSLVERATFGMYTPGTINLRDQPQVRNADGTISTVDSVGVNVDGEELLLPTVTPDGRHFTGPDAVDQAIAEYRKTGRHLGMFYTPEGASKYAEQLHLEYAAGKWASPTTARQVSSYARTAAVAATQLAEQRRGSQAGAGFIEKQIYGGIESFGRNLPGVAAGMLLGPEVGLAYAGASTTGSSYQQAREQGVDVPTAAAFSGVQGGIEVATEFTPMHWFLHDLGAKTPLLKLLAHQIASEIPGEEIATALQDLNEWAFLPENKDKTFRDYLNERPSAAAATAISTLVAVGAQGVTGHATARVLDHLSGAAGASKTRTRSPADFTDVAAQVIGEGPLKTIELPIDTFTSYFQSKNIDPAAMAATLTGDPQAYARARDAGTDLTVPTARYLTALGGSEHATFLAQEARLTPRAPNAREEAALEGAVAGELAAAAPLDTGTVTQTTPATAGQVREAARAMLEQAGIPPAQARIYAELHEAVFSTIGARAGVDPLSLYQRYGLEVHREGLLSPRTATELGPAAAPVTGTESIETDIPASVARPGESTAQREQRRRGHWAQVLATVLREARAVDPTVDDRVVRRAFAERVTRFEDVEALGRDAGTDPQTLLRAIADYGGLWYEKNTGAYRGEIETIKQSNTAPDLWGGVKGVFRQAGLSPDRMVESLRQDPRFQHITDINALLDAVDDAVRHPPEADQFPGTAELAKALGIRAGTAWWRDDTTTAAAEAAPDDETRLYQAARNARRAELEARITQARREGREDLRALRELQDVLDEEGGGETAGETTAPTSYYDEERGVLTFGKDRQFRIDLFAGADLSTLLHESAHVYLEVVGDVIDELASRDPETLTDTQRKMLADYGALLQWFGVENRSEITAAHHEQFARGFEAYLREGQAPNPELRSVFARVRAWLVSIYRTVRQLDVEVSPAIRQVFDRLVATDEAIDAAQEDQQQVAMFTDAVADAAGLSPADRDAYRATVQAATDRARDTLQAKLLQQLQRERTAWWKDERAGVRTSIAGDIAAQPIYKALALLQRGTLPDGSALPAGVLPFKLSQELLVEEFGEGVLKRLPRPLLYTTRNGVPPSVAADLLGFRSGQELVRMLVNTPPLETAIDSAADEEMKRRHGDMLVDGTLGEQARQAVIESGADVFDAEVKALTAAVTRQPGAPRVAPVPPVATIRAIAERRIADTQIRSILPATFAAAARRAGAQALEAAGRQDFAAALQAKQKQILNAELYRAAVAARALVDDGVSSFTPILTGRDATLAKRYDVALVNGARALLAQYELAPKGQTAAAHTYLEQVKRYDPELYNDLDAAIEAASQPAKPWRDLTLDEFIAVRDAVDNLWHLARRSQQMVVEGQALELDEVAATLQARLTAIDTPKEKRGYTRAVTKWENTKLQLMGWLAGLRRVESWIDAIDRGDPQGSFRRVLFTPIADATAQYRVAKRAALEQYLALVKTVESSLTTNEIAAPEINYTFGGTIELLHALLHTGNASNLSKLLRGRYWGSDGPDGSLDSSRWDAFIRRAWREGILTKAHYDYVQAVWNFNESLKPQAQQAHLALYGFLFSEITAQPFETPFGTYPGGYMPAIVDADIAEDAALRADKAILEQQPTSFMFPTTGRGFTKGRVEPYARPLALNLKLVPAHLDQVLRFVHLEPAIKNASRLVMDKGFRNTLHGFDPTVAGEILLPWLQRTAKQTIALSSQGYGGRAEDRFFRGLRRRVGLNAMALNVVNALQQISGLSVALVKVPPGNLARALVQYVRSPRVLAADVAEKSAFMRTREATQIYEVQGHIDDLLLNPSRYEQVRDFAQKHGYILSSAVQNVVDLVTWSGAYDHATADGATETEAVHRADAAVRLTQGTFNPEDLSKFETRSPLARAFTMFYSYYNMKANLLTTEFQATIRELGLKRGAGRLLYVFTFGHLVEALVGALIVDAMMKRLPSASDDDDEAVLGGWLAWFFNIEARSALGLVPGGQVLTAGYNAVFTAERWDDKISSSPAVRAIEDTVQAPTEVYDAIANDKRRKAAVRDSLTAIGLLSGVPVSALSRPLGYLTDVADEKVEPTGPVDVARGLVTGR